MPAERHALLSASASHRWLHCPPSVRLGESFPDRGSDYAAEGSDAHSLCEYKLRKLLGMAAADPTENLTWYNAEMEECADHYAAYIAEKNALVKDTCSDPVVLIEQRVDFSRYVPDGFGTADCVIIADGILHIIDFKYGKGVEVSADDNPQMMLYAIGALEMFDCLYDVGTVSMTIFQPRLSNISMSIVAKDTLLEWAAGELVEKAKLAYDGGGDFACGDWCRFCKAKAVCRRRAEENLRMAQYEFAPPDTLSETETAAILDRADELAAWVSDVKEYALSQALRGVQFPGYKVVEDRSARKFKNDQVVAKVVTDAGFDPFAHKLLGFTEMQKLLGKQQSVNVCQNFPCRPRSGRNTASTRKSTTGALQSIWIWWNRRCVWTRFQERSSPPL